MGLITVHAIDTINNNDDNNEDNLTRRLPDTYIDKLISLWIKIICYECVYLK